MTLEERATVFSCEGNRLVGIVSRSSTPSPRGVLVVVGGPQYRVGSHRQFTLLCRALAKQGVAAMRFDYRGMGDSEGTTRTFEEIRADIRAAIDHFCIEIPELREVVIWGLCDAASAALLEAHRDNRVIGLVLLNPWVRTLAGLAKTQLKHYYWSRLIDREFWRKLVRGEFAVAESMKSFVSALKLAFGSGGMRAARVGSATTSAHNDSDTPLPSRMADGMSRFKGKILLILSGNDLTAQEFEGVVKESQRWRRLLAASRVESRKIPEANHTFSKAEWRNQVAIWTIDWVKSC